MFKHQFNPEYKGEPYENEQGISLTVPDLSFTIQELLLNHTRGLGVPAEQEGLSLGDEEVPIIKDLTDMEQRRAQLKKRQIELDKELRQIHQEKIKAQKEARRKAELTRPKETPETIEKPQENEQNNA